METTLEQTVKTAWNKSKWLIKGGIVGIISLLLLIPMLYVKNLIFEREKRQQEAAHEITQPGISLIFSPMNLLSMPL